MPRPKRWFHVSQDINWDPEFDRLCEEFGLPGVRFFLQVLSILDKTGNHWCIHREFSVKTLARLCGTKPKIILGSYALLIDMKWISVGVDVDMKQFIYAPNYMKYQGNRVHEKEMPIQPSGPPPYLPLPSLLKEKEKDPKKDPKRKTGDESPSPQFHEFWRIYPNKAAKTKAEAAWRKANPQNGTVEKILDAVAAQRLSPQWTKDGGEYIPHAATWLNQKRWEDVLEVDIAKPKQKVALY